MLAELRKFPALLLGAIGHPDVKPGILERHPAPHGLWFAG
jgi:hypothetical protein